ncbi:PBP1A family penicillin-binding protein [Rapidithrix thailandica]|uniref:PBP1A family penicillin-binding protein n=1 Tax=Rapidithrix thailandica TaxID=413964 RepID=A0AAW9S5C8_9BACT
MKLTNNLQNVLTYLRKKLKQFPAKARHMGEYLRTHFQWKWLLLGIIGIFLFGLLCAFGFLLAVHQGSFGKLPSSEELSHIQHHEASEIYSADGLLLGKYFIQERTNITYEQLSKNVTDALVATEDARFFEHNGIDYKSLFRVFFKTILMQDASSGGGSTITQQLAKNLYPREAYGIFALLVSKVKEAIIANRLEEMYSKEEILTLYFNTVPFGDHSFGIETAAERFFNKKPIELNVAEAAVLVGMLKANYTYNPRLFPEKSQERRNVVLSQMEKYGYLESSVKDSLQQLPIELDYQYQTHNEGLATYFREHLRQELQQQVASLQKEDGTPYNLYTDGLKIYTTIDSRAQTMAEKAMSSHMEELQKLFFQHWKNRTPWGKDESFVWKLAQQSPRYQQLQKQGLKEKQIREVFEQPVKTTIFTWQGEEEKEISPLDSVKHHLHFLHAGVLAMDPKSGAVKVWIGGINHKYFKYDHVNTQTKRQVGSTFKPIVYAAALENGISPCQYFSNELVSYAEYDDWTPKNSDGNYEGKYSLTGALTKSVNTVSVKLILENGIDNTIQFARKLGIESDIEPVPSIALGAANISLYEMVNAYSVFANLGYQVKPHYLLRIEDKHGKVLKNFRPATSPQKVVSTQTAQLITEMLKSVVDSGTAASLRSRYGLRNDIAGKTGTTQSHADGWFMGYTPHLVMGVWVGSDYPNIHFRSIKLGQGATMALPIWGKFMQQLNKDESLKAVSRARFKRPSGEVLRLLDCPAFKDNAPFMANFFESLFGPRKKEPNVKQAKKKRKRNQRRRKSHPRIKFRKRR